MPLAPLPPAFASTVTALHRVAERDVSPARTDGHIWLAATSGGFGTPGGEARVEGTELVRGDERTPLDVDAGAARALAEWYALGERVLAELRAEAGPGDDASEARLWPEHFDVAIELGSEARGHARELRRLAGRRGPPRALPLRRAVDRGGAARSDLRRRAASRRRDPAAAALEFFRARRRRPGSTEGSRG